MNARIYVTLKAAVHDPQGQAVENTLHRLGFGGASGVRIGKYVELAVDAASPDEARAQVEAMCEQLIANPVIENYRIEIES